MTTHPTIEAFIKKFSPCDTGITFALSCKTPSEVWDKAEPDDLIWIATRDGVLTDREFLLFAIWSVRQARHLVKDPRSSTALDVVERFANGQADAEELEEAKKKAYAAYAEADGANAAAAGAAYAAYAAGASAAGASAASASASASASAFATREDQASWLRANTRPDFERALLPCVESVAQSSAGKAESPSLKICKL